MIASLPTLADQVRLAAAAAAANAAARLELVQARTVKAAARTSDRGLRFRHAVLALLARGPGLDVRAIEGRLPPELACSYDTVYRLLAVFAERGWVERHSAAASGCIRAKTFAITPEGRLALVELAGRLNHRTGDH